MKKHIPPIIALFLTFLAGTSLTGCGTAAPVQTGGLEILPSDPVLLEEPLETSRRISIGSLAITLPPGWEIYEETSGKGAKQYILTDAHSQYAGICANDETIEAHKDGYEHDIVITPYQIRQMPDSPLQLAAKIKEYFPVPLLYTAQAIQTTDEIEGCWIYGENLSTSEEEYFLFSENESGGKELFHIREGSPLITAFNNDIESFRDLIGEQMVFTNGGSHTVRYGSSMGEREYYFLLNRQTDHSMLATARISPNEITVYRTGAYESPLLVQDTDSNPEHLAVADIDRNGYDDLLCNDWVLDPQYSPHPDSIYDLEGYLWKEENNTFAHVTGEQIMEQYDFFLENKQQRRGCEMVPEDLTAYLSQYILGDKEEMRNIMLPLISDRLLDMETIKELAKAKASIKKHMLTIASTYDGSGVWIETDADNDGIEDIFLCEYLGGSLHLVTYYLFKGTPDGHYILTDGQDSLQEEFRFIRWNEKNYLAKTTWNFEKKEIDGLSLECYENGRYQGGVWIAITAKEGRSGRNVQTSYLQNPSYQNLEPVLEKLAMDYRSGSRLPHGTAEEENNEKDYNRSCDINNDGKTEQYRISLWQTTNFYTVDHLSIVPENTDDLAAIHSIVNADDTSGICMNLWVDKTDYGNITYILYEDGLYDFHICGYLISGAEYEKLIQVDCHVLTEATVTGLEPSNTLKSS